MNSPRRPDGPAIYDGKSYSAAVHLAEDVKPFVAIANGLRERGFSAPAIHHADLDAGFLITEDFGSAGFIEGDPPATDRGALSGRDRHAGGAASRTIARNPAAGAADHLRHPVFDTDALLVEAGLMLEWYLPDRGVEPTNNLRAEFVMMWRDLLEKAAAQTPARTWVLRDFHSPNLIWLGERPGYRQSGHHRLPGRRAGPGRL